MFEAEVTVEWSFSHRLEGFDKQYAEPHDHTWLITATLAVPDLDNRGVSVDFTRLKRKLVDLLAPYQGRFLNESNLPFAEQPTAEHIGLWVADNLNRTYPGLISRVSVGTGEERASFIVPPQVN